MLLIFILTIILFKALPALNTTILETNSDTLNGTNQNETKTCPGKTNDSILQFKGSGYSEGDYATPDEALDYLNSQKETFSETTDTTTTATSNNHKMGIATTAKEEETIKTEATKVEIVKTGATITYHQISFTFYKTKLVINYPDEFTVVELMKSIKDLLLELSAVTQKGFVNEADISKLPIFSGFMDFFSVDEKYIKADGDAVVESLKWINSLILLSLYKELLVLSEEQAGATPEKRSGSDLQADLSVLMNEIYKLIDPSLRRYIQKRGITIIKNVYSGFDTEYKKKTENENENENDLISVQIATSTKVIIKIPTSQGYKLSTIDTLTNKVYEKKYSAMKVDDDDDDGSDTERVSLAELIEETGDQSSKKSKKSKKGFDFGKIERIFGYLLNEIRVIKYRDYDAAMSNLTLGLTESGLEVMETDD